MFDDDGRSDGQVLFLLVCLVPHSGSGEAFVDLFFDSTGYAYPRGDSVGMSIGSCNAIKDSSGSCMDLNMFLSSGLIRR